MLAISMVHVNFLLIFKNKKVVLNKQNDVPEGNSLRNSLFSHDTYTSGLECYV